jgi:transposase
LRTPEGAAIPPNMLAELHRDQARLAMVHEQIRGLEKDRQQRLKDAPDEGPQAMVQMLARVLGVGVETADMLVHEVLYRQLRDERAVGRYAGLTGSPGNSGARRREKGLSKAGNARLRRSLIQLAWRFLLFQPHSALVQWYQARLAQGARKCTAIVALARKLLIALWRMAHTGEVPQGLVLRPAA